MMNRLARMSELVRRLVRHSFLRQVAAVMTGTIVAHGINIAFAPVLSRIFSPADFGVLGIFNFAISILGPLAVLNYPLAIVLAPSEDDAVELVRMSVGISVAASVALGVAVAGEAQFAPNMQLGPIQPYLYLLPIGLLTIGLMQAAQQWVQRKQQFGLLARAMAVQAAGANLSKVVLGWFVLPGAAALIVVGALAPVLVAVVVAVAALSAGKRATGFAVPPMLQRWGQLAREYWRLPFLRTPQTVISALAMGLPVILLAELDGVSAAGQYTLAMQVLMLPSLVVGSSVASVFYPRFAEALRSGGAPKLLRAATAGMAIMGVVPHGLVVLFGPELFRIAFGDDWHLGGQLAQWLSIWLFFWFCARPSMNAIAVLRLERFLLTWEVTSTLVRLVALPVGFFYLSGTVGAVIAFSAVGAVSSIFLTAYVNLVCRQHE